MSCSHCIKIDHDKDGFSIYKCKNGFPTTTGCWAEKNGQLESNMISGVLCNNEEWCGSVYFEYGGKPPIWDMAT